MMCRVAKSRRKRFRIHAILWTNVGTQPEGTRDLGFPEVPELSSSKATGCEKIVSWLRASYRAASVFPALDEPKHRRFDCTKHHRRSSSLMCSFFSPLS
eukprot:6196757-Pleurochrysis_carterae.AAC.1